MASVASARWTSSGEGQFRDEQGHGEAHACGSGDPEQLPVSGIAGSISEPRRDHGLGRPDDAEGLADHAGGDDAPRDRGADGGVEQVHAQRDAGVGEREERDDGVTDPGMQHVFEPFDDRHRFTRQIAGGPRCLHGAQVGELLDVDELGGHARRVGASRPMETPASVALTPASCSANHSRQPIAT